MSADRKTIPGGMCERLLAALLIACVAVVGFWEVMSSRSSRPFDPFEITASDFRGFALGSAKWSVRFLTVKPDPIEPNIFACTVTSKGATAGVTHGDSPVLARLVHGYNMPDCMRIKGYDVKLIRDTRREVEAFGAGEDKTGDTKMGPPVQIWRLRSGAGDTSIWATTMLSAAGFVPTHVDVRSMAFPRIGIPDDPGWLPRGLTWKSFRHPVRNLRLLLRSKWNDSRRDVATFLKLKRPAWASDELLTLVTMASLSSGRAGNEKEVLSYVLSAHQFVAAELRRWRAESR